MATTKSKKPATPKKAPARTSAQRQLSAASTNVRMRLASHDENFRIADRSLVGIQQVLRDFDVAHMQLQGRVTLIEKTIAPSVRDAHTRITVLSNDIHTETQTRELGMATLNAMVVQCTKAIEEDAKIIQGVHNLIQEEIGGIGKSLTMLLESALTPPPKMAPPPPAPRTWWQRLTGQKE